MKVALVYQAGIANLFEVEKFSCEAAERGKVKRLLQHAFEPCEWFARGAQLAGAECHAFGCNMAGDIKDQEWTRELDSLPFSDKFGCAWMAVTATRWEDVKTAGIDDEVTYRRE